MTKNIARAFIVSAFFAVAMTSCELLDDCKTCSVVTYENGTEISRTPGILTCGEELEEKENASPVSIGGNRTTDYVCD
jgi:hypothetical protein